MKILIYSIILLLSFNVAHAFKLSTNYQETSLKLGDEIFESTIPVYNCNIGTTIKYPQNIECWSVVVTWQGDEYIFEPKQPIVFNNHLYVTWEPINSKVTNDCTPDSISMSNGCYKRDTDWSNSFDFELVGNFIPLEVEYPTAVVLGNSPKAKITLSNNLFDSEGGLNVVIKNKKLGNESVVDIPMSFTSGINRLELDVPSELGRYSVTITPYITLAMQNFVSEEDSIEYRVISEGFEENARQGRTDKIAWTLMAVLVIGLLYMIWK